MRRRSSRKLRGKRRAGFYTPFRDARPTTHLTLTFTTASPARQLRSTDFPGWNTSTALSPGKYFTFAFINYSGDIVIFPAWNFHRSPANPETRKSRVKFSYALSISSPPVRLFIRGFRAVAGIIPSTPDIIKCPVLSPEWSFLMPPFLSSGLKSSLTKYQLISLALMNKRLWGNYCK